MPDQKYFTEKKLNVVCINKQLVCWFEIDWTVADKLAQYVRVFLKKLLAFVQPVLKTHHLKRLKVLPRPHLIKQLYQPVLQLDASN